MCELAWTDRESFLADPEATLIGYQVDFDELVAGYFLFNHRVADCGTTLAVHAGEFIDFYDGPMFEERLTRTDRCGGHCLQQSDIEPCPSKCECAYVRAVLQVVRKWPKRGPS